MGKGKYYVVWKGYTPGIYTTWAACQAEVSGYSGAKFKSFKTKEEAELAYKEGINFGQKTKTEEKNADEKEQYILDSISVDAACSGNPGLMEYRGVYTKSGEEIFHFGPIDHGTNNIGEFLAIVHALALLKKENSTLPIYSDSEIAIGWVRKKRMNTTIPRDETTMKLWNIIERAVDWLQNNSYENKIMKWNTKAWGEIKADFGRK